jgi:hypothetical protein
VQQPVQKFATQPAAYPYYAPRQPVQPVQQFNAWRNNTALLRPYNHNAVQQQQQRRVFAPRQAPLPPPPRLQQYRHVRRRRRHHRYY